jgi:hypothetical protein
MGILQQSFLDYARNIQAKMRPLLLGEEYWEDYSQLEHLGMRDINGL